MRSYDVDVIIPIHTDSRPLERTVASVLDHTSAHVRVAFVAHNIDPAIIRRMLGHFAQHPNVMLLHLADGIGSPAGPLNHGIARTSSPYYAVLGSDDELAPHAIDSWLALAREKGSSSVMARVERSLSGPEQLPPTRRRRIRDMDAVKDRLLYRCVPQGLVSRTHHPNLRFSEGLRSGEDLQFTAELWFLGERIAYDRFGPAYILHEEGDDRVTSAIRTVDEDFAFLDRIESSPWHSRLSPAQRTALAMKNLRMHWFDAVLARLNSPEGLRHHLPALRAVHARIEASAPGVTRLLSRPDHDVVDMIHGSEPDPDRLLALLSERWNRTPRTLLTRNLARALHRQGPMRTTLSTGV